MTLVERAKRKIGASDAQVSRAVLTAIEELSPKIRVLNFDRLFL
jgi:hypothetical protein